MTISDFNRIIRTASIGLIVLGVSLAGIHLAGRFGLFQPDPPGILSGNLHRPVQVKPPQEVVNLQDAFSNVAEAVKPAVVNISAIHIQESGENPHDFFYGNPEEFFKKFFGKPGQPEPRDFRREGTGSGVIIDPEGYILTNNHVVQGADQLTVRLSDDKTFKGKVIGTDPRTDLAIIRIKGSNPFPYAELGDSSAIRIGDWVLAIGSPFGLEQTVTAGIISAIRQTLNIEGRAFRDLIQTDAAINQGNSGGPLVNLEGKVIGVNTAIYAPTGVFSGIGFAIPVNRAKGILKDLIEKGYVERSFMGVEIVEVDDVMRQQFDLDDNTGALVNRVFEDSPADKAGVQRGDIILKFDGKKVESVGALQDMVARTAVDKKVKVVVQRNGKEKTLTLITETMPSHVALGESSNEEKEKEPQTADWLGGKFSDLTQRVREAFGVPETVKEGIALVDAPASSLAFDAGLRRGDVIRSVNRKAVSSVSKLDDMKDGFDPKKGLVMDVFRQGRWFYVSYKQLE